MVEIQLTKGQVAIVDDEDAARVCKYKWRAAQDRTAKTYYATRTKRLLNGRKKTIFMHRFILEITNPAVEVDHKNHLGLDNRKENMRLCSRAENSRNRGPQSNSCSGLKGVFWDRRCRKWFGQIRVNGKQKYLGVHASKEKAAKAYNQAAIEFFGEYAYINEI